jgi:hypothetical protein
VTIEVTGHEPLRFNPNNAVTAGVERVITADGASLIRKRLRRPIEQVTSAAASWAASSDPRHWNYWRREAEVYADDALRNGLRGTGLDLPQCTVEDTADGATLWLEDVIGTPGAGFALEDHSAVALGLGRWQSQGPLDRPWTSHRFLRTYSGSRPAPPEDWDNDDRWGQPLIRETWPSGLREGWRRLLEHRELLLRVMELLPRTRSHLDVWVCNEIRRDSGEITLLDWSACGDGAIGEDLGNHIPDAVFDLFWPAERLEELDTVCFDAYIAGLTDGGWHGNRDQVRLGVVASCVKYTWLLPLMLGQASAAVHRAYHREVAGRLLFQQRGIALMHLVQWCDEALRLSPHVDDG